MIKSIQLMVGPTTIPSRILHAMNRDIISHRSEEYFRIHQRVSRNLKRLFETEKDVLTLTTSGTGTMESVIQNCFSPNDQVVVPIIGNFSERYAKIAEVYGLNVKRVEFELGETADVSKVMEQVNLDTKGVLLVHNESSTGVYNDLEAFGNALKDTKTLLVTDSVSGVGGLEIKMDEWNVDVALTSSQKALMAPPGLGFVCLSDKAWDAVEKSKYPKFYFDYKKARESNKTHQTPWTPAIFTIFAVDESLNMIFEEGLDNLYCRHKNNAKLVREGIKELGLSIFPKDENYSSPTLTCIKATGKSKAIVKRLAEEGITVNGGLAPLAEDTFRVGTMGYVSEYDVVAFLYALEKVLNSFN